MSRSNIVFLVFYLILLSIEIIGEHINAVYKNDLLMYIMQPALVLSLIIYFLYEIKGKWTKFSAFIGIGLGLDWIGDVILTLYHDQFNMPSMAAYFLGHVCYAIGFGYSIQKKGYKVSLISRFIYSLPPLFYGVVYYFFIIHHLSKPNAESVYILPASGYVVSVLVMSTIALWRLGTTSDTSYWCIAAGALFYMLSDSVTGYDYFVEKIPYRYVGTMFTYGIALFLIMMGTLHHPVKTEQDKAD